MSFNSVYFLLCLPVVIIAYWVLPKRFRWIMLLAVSYLFYMSWNVWLIFLILFTTVVSYVAARLMAKYNSVKIKRLCLIVTLISCLGVLFFFKYFTFAVNLVIDIINLGRHNFAEFTFSLLLPVGISFYTFQTLSYVIDVYRAKIDAERHFGYYALFVSFFPQLVAGPIERPENLLPQLKSDKTFDKNNFLQGLRIAVIGYFKKIVIADGVGVFVNRVYNNVSAANGITVLLATILFAVQIYCDFSGYSEIAIGVAKMMGIRLSDNFNNPYLATSIKDFWRRWHITLTSWFTDYVYIPLGGNRCKLWRWMLNVMIVFLLSGLWHGAALTFVVWGGIHGLYQIIGALKNKLISKCVSAEKVQMLQTNAYVMVFKRVVTFALVCFAWIFFRGNTLSDCGEMVAKIFTDWSGGSAALKAIGFDSRACISVMFMLVLLILFRFMALPQKKNIGAWGREGVLHHVVYVYLVLAIAVAWLALAVDGGVSSFIYFQF